MCHCSKRCKLNPYPLHLCSEIILISIVKAVLRLKSTVMTTPMGMSDFEDGLSKH